MQFNSSSTVSVSVSDSIMVRVISKEGDIFELPFNAIKGANLVATMFDVEEAEADEENIQEMPILNVSTSILSKVVDFANHTLEESLPEIPKPIPSLVMSEFVPKWYADLVDNVTQEDLSGLLLAANFMDMPDLLSLTCAKTASIIRGKTYEELCNQFGVDYIEQSKCAPIDDDELKKIYPWAE